MKDEEKRKKQPVGEPVVEKTGEQQRPGMKEGFVRNVTFSYLFATGVLAMLVIASFFVLHAITKAQKTNAAQVNISGRQRMLSQKIMHSSFQLVKFAGQASSVDLVETKRHELLDAVQLFEQSQVALLHGDLEMGLPGNPSPALRAKYFDGAVSLDTRLREYSAAARFLARAPRAELTELNPRLLRMSAAAGDLLKSLDEVVTQYQEESEVDIASLQRWYFVIMVLSLFVLLLLVMYVFRPMSSRIRRETRELMRSEARIHTIVDNMVDGLITINEKGLIESFNPSAELVFGYKASEVVGRNVKMLMPEPYNSEHDGYLRRYLQTRKANVIGKGAEVSGVRRDGSVFPLEIAISEMRMGEERTFVGIVRDITERKLAEGQIEASLNEKEILLKEIHHRVKNNLQFISSILSIQAGYLEDGKARDFFEDNQKRIRSMAFIHEKLYQSTNFARIGFPEYVQNLTSYLLRSYRVDSTLIELKVNVEDCSLDIDTAIPCGLIINELFSNSIKHAFRGREGGEVSIDFRCDKKSCIMVVSDNGVGLPENTQFPDMESFGLQLVRDLSDQLDGKIKLDRKNGTSFTITFPKAG